MGKLISTVASVFTGGLLGGDKDPAPAPAPLPAATPQKTQVDPDRGEQVAAARRRALQQSKSAGRSSFRIDLGGTSSTNDGGQTRSGLTIA